jgi:hypothetical protein
MLDRIEIANSSAKLDRHVAGGSDNRLDRALVFWLARGRTIQIDDMKSPRTEFCPPRRHRSGVLGKNSCVFHRALLQAHAFSVLKINRGNDQHTASYELGVILKTSWNAAREGERKKSENGECAKE